MQIPHRLPVLHGQSSGSDQPGYTARREADSAIWRRQFLQTFLERDLPQLGVQIPAAALNLVGAR